MDPTLTEDELRKLDIFVEWCRKEGVTFPKLKFGAFFPIEGRGVSCSEKIESGEPFCRVPLSMIISAPTVSRTEIGKQIFDFLQKNPPPPVEGFSLNASNITFTENDHEKLAPSNSAVKDESPWREDWLLVYLFMLHEMSLNKSTNPSYWKYYFDILPSKDELFGQQPLCFEEKELELLRGTNLYESVTHMKKRGKRIYDRCVPLFEQVKR